VIRRIAGCVVIPSALCFVIPSSPLRCHSERSEESAFRLFFRAHRSFVIPSVARNLLSHQSRRCRKLACEFRILEQIRASRFTRRVSCLQSRKQGLSMATHQNLGEAIDILIDQIDALREALSHPRTDPATGFAVADVPLDAVDRLKTVVDHFRLFLWAYLDSHPRGGADPKARLRHLRMERAADMLSQLSSDFRSSGVPPTEDAARLRDQIRAMEPIMVRRPLRPSGTDR
jgi:hypothetical protein